MNKILLLTDGKAGHENQSRALIRALGYEPVAFEIHFKSRLHKAISYVLDRLGIRTTALFDHCPTVTPDAFASIVGTGSGTFYAASALAKKSNLSCGVILYPRGYVLSHFDCILAPTFDRPAKASNVIPIPANLVANDADFYEKGVTAFRLRHTGPTDQAVAVIIGGPNKASTLTPQWVKQQLDALFAEKNSHGDPLRYWVTTSRRTPPEVEALVDQYPWDYKLLYSKDHFNPIPAFVKLATRLYVTAESTGMLSEACTFGHAHVIALDNLKPGNHKFRRFVDNLRAAGYLDGNRKIDLSDAMIRARQLMQLAPTGTDQ